MEKIKFKIADFAKEIGCSQKTIYNKIEKGELITVNEIQKGRTITLILTDNKQIQELKNIYNALKVNEIQYYDSETFNESKENSENYKEHSKSDTVSDIVNKVIELSENYNERIMKVNEELMSYKSRVPLLEYKADREGLYLSQIDDLKADNDKLLSANEKLQKSKNKVIVTLLSVIVLFVLIACALCILLVIEHKKPPKIVQTEKVVEKVVEKPVYKYIYRK